MHITCAGPSNSVRTTKFMSGQLTCSDQHFNGALTTRAARLHFSEAFLPSVKAKMTGNDGRDRQEMRGYKGHGQIKARKVILLNHNEGAHKLLDSLYIYSVTAPCLCCVKS